MQAVLVRHVFALAFSFLLGIYLIPIIIKAAQKIGFMDVPDGRLKHQKKPIPYLGGVAVFLPFITTLGLCYPFENQILWLLLGTTLLLFIGLVDDLKALKPHQKFFGQFIAALCCIKGGFSLKTPFFSSISNVLWSLFWMLSVINAYNLVDVMDGLCALLALTSAATFGIIAFMWGKFSISVLMAAFIGSLGAFFIFNKPQAKIYLGDAGSLFIGGFLAAVPFLFDWPSSLFAMPLTDYYFPVISSFIKTILDVFLIPSIILGIPLLEGLGLLVIRTYLGIPFYNGSPHHFSIYLQKLGWSRANILWFVCAGSTVLSVVSLLFLQQILSLGGLFLILLTFIVGWAVIIFRH